MTLRRIWTNLKRIVWEDSFDVVEFFGSINSFGWGLWFILHPALFDVGTSVYAILSKFGNEYLWGSVLLCVGFARIVGIALDRYRFRKATAMIATILWAFVCVGFYQQNPHAIVVFVTAQNTVLSAWEYIRHSRRARIRKEIREEIHSDRKKI